MKYQLKRSTGNLIVASIGLILLVGIFISFSASWDEIFIHGIIPILIFGGILVYEIVRIRGDKFFFDENGFTIDGESYSYSQIDYLQVYAVSSRFRSTENIDIFINDDSEYIFGFNKNYQNSGKFLEFAQNHNVKIKIGLSEE